MRSGQSPSNKWWPRRDKKLGWSPEERKRGKQGESEEEIEGEKGIGGTVTRSINMGRKANWRKRGKNSMMTLYYANRLAVWPRYRIIQTSLNVTRHRASSCISRMHSITCFVLPFGEGRGRKVTKWEKGALAGFTETNLRRKQGGRLGKISVMENPEQEESRRGWIMWISV